MIYVKRKAQYTGWSESVFDVLNGNKLIHREIENPMNAIRLALIEAAVTGQEVTIDKVTAGEACDIDRGNASFSQHSMDIQGLTRTV